MQAFGARSVVEEEHRKSIGDRAVGALPALFVALAIVSAALTVVTLYNYVEGLTAARQVALELSSLEATTAGPSPNVQVTFDLTNSSAMEMKVQEIHFSLYLNGEFIGSNYTPFDDALLQPYEQTQLTTVIPLRPLFLQRVEQGTEREMQNWFLRGTFRLYLPYREKDLWVNVRESWSEPR
jgi:hypothetical protein